MALTLKQRLQQPQVLLAPGVYDPLTALIAEQSGFERSTSLVRRLPTRGWAAPTSV